MNQHIVKAVSGQLDVEFRQNHRAMSLPAQQWPHGLGWHASTRLAGQSPQQRKLIRLQVQPQIFHPAIMVHQIKRQITDMAKPRQNSFAIGKQLNSVQERHSQPRARIEKTLVDVTIK
ncbi:MAG: hypothetical protein ACXIUO_11630 [Erythrobacter sp.]